MRGKTHMLGGVAAGLIGFQLTGDLISANTDTVVPLQKTIVFGSMLTGAFFGSILPDIDHKGSFIGRRMKILSFLVHHSLGHRGLTHSLLFAILVPALFGFLTLQFATGEIQGVLIAGIFGLFLGILSHIFLDALTVSGVPLFAPFTNKTFRFGRFRTGGIGEYVVAFGLVIGIFVLTGQIIQL